MGTCGGGETAGSSRHRGCGIGGGGQAASSRGGASGRGPRRPLSAVARPRRRAPGNSAPAPCASRNRPGSSAGGIRRRSRSCRAPARSTDAAPSSSSRTRRTAAASAARSACRRALYRRSRPAAPSPAPSPRWSATLNSALLNGRTRLPSPLVPSGNRISASPAASRPAMLSRCRAVLRTWRSINTERCSRASQPNSGQRATSVLATNEPAISDPRTVMSR